MKTRFFVSLAAIAGLATFSLVAYAAPVDVSGVACPDDSVGISIADVTAAKQGGGDQAAYACYGAIYGNDPSSPGGQIYDGTETFNFLTKWDVDESKTTGLNIGLSAPGSSSGSFTFSSPQFFDGNWMVVLKASNCWAGWTFVGGAYTGGDFDIGFRSVGGQTKSCVEDSSNPPGLSHIAIYGTLGEPTIVPEPGTLALLGLGLVGFGLARRRIAA